MGKGGLVTCGDSLPVFDKPQPEPLRGGAVYGGFGKMGVPAFFLD